MKWDSDSNDVFCKMLYHIYKIFKRLIPFIFKEHEGHHTFSSIRICWLTVIVEQFLGTAALHHVDNVISTI